MTKRRGGVFGAVRVSLVRRQLLPLTRTVEALQTAPHFLLVAQAGFFAKSAMAARAITPPILQGPTAKEKKYDRQLRLWAASGQEALENASVLLLNSGSGVVGVETLKNLILPGIGNFTIVDGEKVQESDLGVNFFLTEKSLGKSRAAECCRYLNELNPDVKGRAIEKVNICEVPASTSWLMLHSL